MRSLRVCSLSLAFLLFAACARSPSARLKSDIQEITSWTATARYVGQSWLKGNVPHAYAAQTLRAAQETLEDEAQSIQEQSTEGDSQLQSSLAGQVRAISQVINLMRSSVESRDNNALTQLLKRLDAEDKAVKAAAASGGVGP
jgi:hypothetical protein